MGAHHTSSPMQALATPHPKAPTACTPAHWSAKGMHSSSIHMVRPDTSHLFRQSRGQVPRPSMLPRGESRPVP